MVTLQGEIVGLAIDLDTARHYVERIHEHLIRADHHANQARKLILDLKERDGWRVLGYSSWRQCVMEEFETSVRTVYRQLDAAAVELDLCPNGSQVGQINERVLRPLTKRNYDAEARQGIWAIANEVVGEGGKVTSGVVEVVIETVKEILVTGATDGEDGMHPLTERVHAQIVAAVREKKIAHKQHIKHMDAKRDYILGGIPVEKVTRGFGESRVAAIITPDDLQRDKLTEAMRLGKPIYCSLWTEE